MGKRISFIIDEEVDKKLRLRQAKMIEKTTDTVTYSSLINHLLKKALA